jgi:hypothetical protein
MRAETESALDPVVVRPRMRIGHPVAPSGARPREVRTRVIP